MPPTNFRYQGAVTHWNEERGYGFVSMPDGSKPLFVHVHDLPNRMAPAVGQQLSFSIGSDQGGRTRAVRIEVLVPGQSAARFRSQSSGTTASAQSDHRLSGRASRSRPGLASAIVALIVFAGIIVAAKLAWSVPMWIPLWYSVASLLSFALYTRDKSAALRGAWRTSEVTLHVVDLAGGWPGALIAQQVFRHKTRKRDFRGVFWFTVVVNILVFVFVVSPLFARIAL